MTEINLFTLAPGRAIEIPSQTMQHERPLQQLFESNLENLLGARFLASEFQAGDGRIDTLGLDDANRPVVIEYKRRADENVITQGLSYLAWVKQNPASIKLHVLENLGSTAASKINFYAPRLICVASEFSSKDKSAVGAWSQDIQLVRYVKFGEDLLMLEHLNATSKPRPRPPIPNPLPSVRNRNANPLSAKLAKAPENLIQLYEKLTHYLKDLGSDVRERNLKHIVVFTRRKNFACLMLFPSQQTIKAYVNLDPDMIELIPGFTRDMRGIGHYGTGDVEITISTEADLARAKPLLQKSYEAS